MQDKFDTNKKWQIGYLRTFTDKLMLRIEKVANEKIKQKNEMIRFSSPDKE